MKNQEAGTVRVLNLALVDEVAKVLETYRHWHKKRQEEYAEETHRVGKEVYKVYKELGWKGLGLLANKIDYHQSTLLRWANWSQRPLEAVKADLKRGVGVFEQMRMMEGKQARKDRLLDNAEKTLNQLEEMKDPADESAFMQLREALKHDARSEFLGILHRIASAKKADTKFKVKVYDDLEKVVRRIVRTHKEE